MPDTCKAKYRWTREQLTIAMRHHQATKLRRWVVVMMKVFSIVLLSVIGVVLLAWILLPSTSAPPWALLFLVIFCFYLLMFDRVNAWSWGRRFGKRPDADMEVEWEFSMKEIKTQSALGEATLQWKGFFKVVEASDGFLFYSFEKLFHWMPFSAFQSPECIKLVRTFVIENNVPLIQQRPNVLRISVGRVANERLTEEEAATQFCVELSRVEATWSLNKQLSLERGERERGSRKERAVEVSEAE